MLPPSGSLTSSRKYGQARPEAATLKVMQPFVATVVEVGQYAESLIMNAERTWFGVLLYGAWIPPSQLALPAGRTAWALIHPFHHSGTGRFAKENVRAKEKRTSEG